MSIQILIGTLAMIVLLVVSFIASWSIVLVVMGSLLVLRIIEYIKGRCSTWSQVKTNT